MKPWFCLVCACLVVVALPVLAAQPAIPKASCGIDPSCGSLSEAYQKALKFEETRQFAPAEEIYRELIRRCSGEQGWRMRSDAEQGLLRIKNMRTLFCLSQSQLLAVLAKTFRDWQPSELADFERRGWITSWKIDGKKIYAASNPTNLQFFDTTLMARNEAAAKNYRKFAQIFLDESAKLDALRAGTAPESYVAPVRMVYSATLRVRQADLPAGRLVRAWFPCPLLTPAIQNIRVVSVQPAGALKSCPDVEAQMGIIYLEVPRPEKDDLVIEMKDGRVMMLMRTEMGGQYKSISTDGGETWSEPTPTPLVGTAAPMSLSRVPETGDLLAVWNRNPGAKSRNPLTAALSKDEGETWGNVRNIEDAPDNNWCYPAVTWVKDRALLTYFNWGKGSRWARLGSPLKLKTLPMAWFYQ